MFESLGVKEGEGVDFFFFNCCSGLSLKHINKQKKNQAPALGNSSRCLELELRVGVLGTVSGNSPKPWHEGHYGTEVMRTEDTT